MKRNASLDILRSLAAIAVVVYHVFGSSANNDPLVSANLHLFITAVSTALQWHVPVFFIITGYLWLQDEKDCTYKKMIPNIRRFIYVLITVGFAYAILERFFESKSFSIALFLNSMAAVLSGNLWDHMWYLYAIIGVYLLLPILKKIFTYATEKELILFAILLFVFNILCPLIYDLIEYKFPVDFPTSSSLFYVCVGGLIAKINSPRKAVIPLLGFCFSSMAIFLITLFTESADTWLALLKCISAIALFLTVQAMPLKNTGGLLRTFSECTFGLYLFHPFFINIMIKLLHFYPLRYPPLISLPITCGMIVILSVVTTYLLRHIPLVRKYIL